jgi:pyruvate kinase
MADFVANQRPEHAPIFAFAPRDTVARRLCLNRGTVPLSLPFDAPSDSAIPVAELVLKEAGFVHSGDKIVIVSDAPGSAGHFDSVQVRTIS